MSLTFYNSPELKGQALVNAVKAFMTQHNMTDDSFTMEMESRLVLPDYYQLRKVIKRFIDFSDPFETNIDINIARVDVAFKAKQEEGYCTSIGITMRGGSEDASVIREAALLLRRADANTMSLRDVNNVIHTNVSLTSCIQIADEIGLNYLKLWDQRENLKTQFRNCVTWEDIKNVTITFD